MMNASMLHPDSRPAFSFAEQVHHGGLLRQRMSAAIHALLHVHKLLLTEGCQSNPSECCSALG